MNSFKKSILIAVLALTLGALSSGANAALLSWPGTVSEMTTMSQFLTSSGAHFSSYTGGALSGSYYVTPLAFEAADTVQFREGAASLFTNKNLASEFGQVKTVANMSLGNYFDVTKNQATSVNDFTTNPTFPAVKVLELTQNWRLSNGLTLSAGTLILGLNDGGSCDGDYDDFILAASKTAPTPIPGAVWLLGSGLLGVMGFKRTRKTEKA